MESTRAEKCLDVEYAVGYSPKHHSSAISRFLGDNVVLAANNFAYVKQFRWKNILNQDLVHFCLIID